MKSVKTPRCPACRSTELVQVERQREFHPRGKRVVVDLLTLRCQSCGAESTRAAQHDENLSRLKARKAQYDGLLLGEEIFSLRRRYGVTQQAAAKIFGKGKIAFSRYENETSYPDESTTLLLTLAIEKPDVIRWLADKAGVELPLWQARCEDERRAKVRVVPDTVRVVFEGAPDKVAQQWAENEMARKRSRVAPAVRRDLFDGSREGVRRLIAPANDHNFSVEVAYG